MGLGAFVVKRLVGAVLVTVGVTLITFFLVHLAPGDPIRIALMLHASSDAVKQLAHQYGIDQPLFVQYLNYMKGPLVGAPAPNGKRDWGRRLAHPPGAGFGGGDRRGEGGGPARGIGRLPPQY